MIFTKEQWKKVYDRYRADFNRKETRLPPDVILDILELDAVEHGIHPTWVKFWVDRSDNARWANAVYVIIKFPPGKFPHDWDKDRGVRKS
jgi:hypothetical protein